GQLACSPGRARRAAASRTGQPGSLAQRGIRTAERRAARAASWREPRSQRPSGSSGLGRDRRALAVFRRLVRRRRVHRMARAAGTLRPTGRRAPRRREFSLLGRQPAASGSVAHLGYWAAAVAWRTGSPRAAIAVRHASRAVCARAWAMRRRTPLLTRQALAHGG